MSVVIYVLDTDPNLAADIANEIATLLDSAKNPYTERACGPGIADRGDRIQEFYFVK